MRLPTRTLLKPRTLLPGRAFTCSHSTLLPGRSDHDNVQKGGQGDAQPRLESAPNHAPDSLEGREDRNARLTQEAGQTSGKAGSDAGEVNAEKLEQEKSQEKGKSK